MGGSTLPLAPDAYSGRRLGKYEVLCRLSTGGMAEIFLASQRGLAGFRKLVVLKQILPDIKGEEEFVQMFLDEARVTAAFQHPHIAQVYDLDVADGELFLAMEFVPGATLVEVAKACRAANEPIPIGFGLAAARDTALALHYAHTFTDPLGRPTSVIHRDVAEKNIMVTYEGVTKLLDFGIAKNLARKGRTQIGMVKGTNGYMSPEQILGERLDARSDLFSLGVVLHECLTGLRLFHAKTPAAGAGAVLHGQVPPPSQANRDVPPELDAIVLKALARQREDRYSSTLEFARAMERAMGSLIWHPEQNGELIRRFFEDRRVQTRQLLMAGQALSGEGSGEVNLAQLIANSVVQAPQLSEEPETRPALPQITSTLPPAPRPSLLAMAAVSSARPTPPTPPPQEAPQARPPTPPRGASTRRLTSTGTPTVTPPESSALRRPVFEPLPQKRSTTGVMSALGPPPPPPVDERTGRTDTNTDERTGRTDPSANELTGRTDPGANELTGRTDPGANELTGRTNPGDEPIDERRARTEATRVAPPEAPEPAPFEERAQEVPQAEVLTAIEQPARSQTRSRPVRMDLLGTIPSAEPPAGLQLPPDDERASVETREVFSPPPRTRSMDMERVPSRTSNPHMRAMRRRAPEPTPAPAAVDEEFLPPDFSTSLGRTGPPHLGDEPVSDTNETHIPYLEDKTSRMAPAGVASSPARQRSGLLIGVAVGVLLLGVLSAVLALELDGGRLLALIDPPPSSEDRGQLQPLTPPRAIGKPPPPAPGKAPAPALAEPPTPIEAAAPSTPPEEAEAAAAEPESAQSGQDLDIVMDEPEEPSPSTKKAPRTPPRRKGEDEPSATPASAGTGQLTLVTEPYAKVYLGRRYLGQTPLFKLNLPSGRHSLKFVREDGQSHRISVEIKPGELTARKINLDQPNAP